MTVIGRSAATALDARLRTELWRRIEEHLADGHTLATGQQFQTAIESAYVDFTGQKPPVDMSVRLRRLIHSVNVGRPDTYLAEGVQNGVQKAFARGVERLNWDLAQIQRHGSASIQRFLRRERVRSFLQEIQLDPALIEVSRCVQHGVAVARANQRTVRASMAAARRSTLLAPVEHVRPALTTAVTDDVETLLDAPLKAAVGDGSIPPEEAQRRLRETERVRLQFYARIMERLTQTVSIYVEDGLLSAADEACFRALAEIDAAEHASDLGAAEAEGRRAALLDEKERNKLSTVVDKAVSGTVVHLQVFDSLQKIRGEYDGLLRTLIQHKELVMADDDGGDRTPLMSALMRTPGFLDLAVATMERKDPEIRLLSARLPPYAVLAPDKLGPAGQMRIEESFVDDLRRLSASEYEHKLQSQDRAERTRAAEDIRSLIHLLDRLIEATPFRRKVRLMIANRVLQACGSEIEAIYRNGRVIAAARGKAQVLLRNRLEKVFVNASPEEEAAVRRRSQGLLLGMEQKMAAEAEQDADDILDSLRDFGGDGPTEAPDDTSGDVELQLSDVEKSRGALIVFVQLRVEGRLQKVESLIMPDPEDSKRHVLAERDDAGEMVPQMRRNRLRYVNRRTDGSWEALTG